MAFFFRRRECLLPTWRTVLLTLVVAMLVGFAFLRNVYQWLAVQDSRPGAVLIAEGWAPDYALAAALEEFRSHPYRGLYVTGVPMEKGGVLSEYGSFAELSAATLRRLGADPATVHAVPSADVRRDRTYATAVALRDWLRDRQIPADRINVLSLGAHARRTRLLYEYAFGPGTQVGVIAHPPRDYDPAHWWRTSQGVRVLVGELVGYLYARFLFRPETA